MDDYIRMGKIGLLSNNMVERIVNSATENSYRVMAEMIIEICRQSVSHGGVWNIVQYLGECVVEEEKHTVQQCRQTS